MSEGMGVTLKVQPVLARIATNIAAASPFSNIAAREGTVWCVRFPPTAPSTFREHTKEKRYKEDRKSQNHPLESLYVVFHCSRRKNPPLMHSA